MITEASTVIVFTGGEMLEVYGRYEWVAAAVDGRLKPSASMWNTHEIGELLPGVPTHEDWSAQPPGAPLHPCPRELMGYTDLRMLADGRVSTLRLTSVARLESVTVVVPSIAYFYPSREF